MFLRFCSQNQWTNYGKKARSYRQEQPQQSKQNLDITENIIVEPEDVFEGTTKNIRISFMDKCPECSGRGSKCYRCGGSGLTTISKNLSVKIPKGVKEGQNPIALEGALKLKEIFKLKKFLEIQEN